jgi:predicted NAD/FAD-binding protein
MRIAVIGAGIAGLTAAYRLHRDHEITVFEANGYPGGHTNTVDVEIDGDCYAIDTGFIVFNHRTYPKFVQLLDELGVISRPTTMGFSVRDDRTGLEFNGESVNGLFAQRRNLFRPSFYRLVADIVRFYREAKRLKSSIDDRMTVGEYLLKHRYSTGFIDQFLLPMGSAIWSSPRDRFLEFPMRFMLEFYDNHGLLSLTDRPVWHVIDRGSRTYVRAITAGFRDRIRLRTPITRVVRQPDRVTVFTNQSDPEHFDHVVFACHSDQALRMLGRDATTAEQEILTSFPYEKNIAVLHTDANVLPRLKRAWASWNYRIPREKSNAATVTYWMNSLQGLRSRQTFCVTLNDESSIDPAKVLRRIEYHHPRFTVARSAASARRSELLNANRSSFCGAYWGNGFHEDGVNSALAVVAAIREVRIPAVNSRCNGVAHSWS